MGRPFLLFSQQHDAGRTQENEALNRVLDLSRSAALALGMSHTGTAPVHLQVVRDHQSTRRVRFGA
jgi:hypothetical protein